MNKNKEAGIYIHIPFCKTKCNYCDFYSIINKSNEDVFIEALLNEINLRKDFFTSEAKITSIYFGGGTPSYIKNSNIEKILKAIKDTFPVQVNTEITLEANPDDLDEYKLQEYTQMGFNRLSMGVQSLLPEQLKFMQRRHTVQQAVEAVNNAIRAGFNNLSIDLIYGLPKMSIEDWAFTLNQVMKWPIQHISAYHLTVEEGTALHKQVLNGQVKEIEDDFSFQQFELLMDIAANNGFEQYEISNFARNKMYSRHNTSYWQQKQYLGLGPSAHSYDLDSRCWNINQLDQYMMRIENLESFYECEQLTPISKFNDMILTSLRTSNGLNKNQLFEYFKPGREWHTLLNDHLEKGNLYKNVENYCLSRKGIHIADTIMSDLILLEK